MAVLDAASLRVVREKDGEHDATDIPRAAPQVIKKISSC